MTTEEITKLVEEYVEEIYPHEEFEDIGQMDFLRNTAKKNIASFIRWLLRTHCIVEKSKVEEAEEVTIDGWVARNKDNSLYLFKAEPWYNSPRGYWDDHLMSIGCFSIPSESFPHITFDNSPIEIALTLKPKKT